MSAEGEGTDLEGRVLGVFSVAAGTWVCFLVLMGLAF